MVNNMIGSQATKYEGRAIKRTCNITAIPMKNRISGMILKITLPAALIVEGYHPDTAAIKIEPKE